jgi:hypothetical protein
MFDRRVDQVSRSLALVVNVSETQIMGLDIKHWPVILAAMATEIA